MAPAKDFTISSIMPNYNHGHLIGGAIEAVLNQSYRPLELIIVDDCSSDNSMEIIEQFIRKDPIVRVIRNKQNMGVRYTVQLGIEEAKGTYTYGGGADDRVLPGFFEKSITILKKHPEAGLCLSDPGSFEDEGGKITSHPLFWSDEPCYFSPTELADVMKGGYIPGISNIARRDAYFAAGGLGYEELRWHSDWFLWHVMGMRHGICYVPECLAAQRVDAKSYSTGRRDPEVQTHVLKFILSLLKSEKFRDVVPGFIRGSLMSHFGDEIVHTVMGDPKLWDTETMLLIQEPLTRWTNKIREVQLERHKKLTDDYRIQEAVYNANKLADSGEVDKAMEMLLSIIHTFPTVMRGYVALAGVSVKTGDTTSAIDLLNAAAKFAPNNGEIQRTLGSVYSKAGQSDLAKDAFKKACLIDPTDTLAKNGLVSLGEKV